MNWLNYGYLGSISIVLCLGLLMIFNTTSAEVIEVGRWDLAFHAIVRQLLYLMLASFLGLGLMAVGYKEVLKFSSLFLVFCAVLLALVLVPGIGQKINGARRWISLLGNSIQPSEFAKYAIGFYFIEKMGDFLVTGKFLLKIFIKVLGFCLIPIVLTVLEPDNGTALIMFMTLIGLFILTKIPLKIWLLPLCLMMVVGGIFALQMPHVQKRLEVFKNPENDILGKGHQSHQSKIAIGSGGLLGKGIGSSLQKFGFLPEARSDYIGAVFAEETGFLGVVVLIVLYLIHLISGVGIALRVRCPKGALIVMLVTFLICMQAFINLGVISCLLPSKGTNLPFFSHGGSSMIASVIAVFMVLSVVRQHKKESLVFFKKS
jgi:cell division protein FtsW